MKGYNGEHRRKAASLTFGIVFSTGFLILEHPNCYFPDPLPTCSHATWEGSSVAVFTWRQEAQDSMPSTGLKRVVGRADKKGDTGRLRNNALGLRDFPETSS